MFCLLGHNHWCSGLTPGTLLMVFGGTIYDGRNSNHNSLKPILSGQNGMIFSRKVLELSSFQLYSLTRSIEINLDCCTVRNNPQIIGLK